MTAISVQEGQSHHQIPVHYVQMEHLQMIIKTLAKLNVEMASDIQVKNEMMVIDKLMMDALHLVPFNLDYLLVMEDQLQLQIFAHFVHQLEEQSQKTKEVEYLFEEMA